MGIFLLIVGILLFIGLVVVHEFGHFIMARRNGVDVEEFGIGFPPAFFKRKTKGGWLFSLNLLPLGGFVKLKGEHDADQEKGTFGAASLSAKSKIMAAGVVMNLLAAFLFFTVLAWVGTPVLVCNQFTVPGDTSYTSSGSATTTIDSVDPGSPASKIGMHKGDKLLAAAPAGQDLKPLTPECAHYFSDVTAANAGQALTVRFQHDGQTITRTAHLLTDQEVEASQKTKHPKGHLGVTTDAGLRFAHSTWSAPITAVGQMGQFTALTFQGLGRALAGLGGIISGGVTGNTQARQAAQTEASSQVSGPVGIFFVLKDGSALGIRFVLFIIAIISLTLAIMNLLPIPALDGGRLWITLIAHGIKRPLTQEREELINALGFMVLMTLMVLVTVVDVKRFF